VQAGGDRRGDLAGCAALGVDDEGGHLSVERLALMGQCRQPRGRVAGKQRTTVAVTDAHDQRREGRP